MIITLSIWDLVKDTILLPLVQKGTQGITWKFSKDEWLEGNGNV